MASRICSSSCFCLHVLILLFFFCCCCCGRGADNSTTADTISWGQSLSGKQTIVSKGGTFELGFFTPGNSLNHYIGIWYKTRPERTVVWVANREKPVADASSSELRIALDGNLVILGRSKTRIWSSNLTSTAPNSTTAAVLLESGNLVLLAGSDSSVPYWQSFDHPTDTWLPGGRIGWNKLSKEYMTLTSWRSPDDPAPGSYSYGMDPKGSNQLVQIWNGSEIYWTSGEWNGQYFASVPEMTRNNVYNYTYVESDKYITYSLFDTEIITRFVAEMSGQGNQWAWLNHSAYWILVWSQPKLRCQIYSLCGPFGFCVENSVPLCQCLQGFEPAHVGDWNSTRWSGGCVRKTRLKCGSGSDGGEEDKFLMMPQVQLPVNSGSLAAGSADECEFECLRNCSCTAYAFDAEVCLVWNGNLWNLQQPTDDANGTNGTVYLRLAASELPTPLRPRSKEGLDTGVVVGAVGGFLVLLAVILVLIRRRRRGRLSRLSKQAKDGSLVLFRYSDLQSLTKNFSERLGGGGFGSVYKGVLPDSTAIAVKKLEGLRQGEKQFRAEVSTIGSIQHVNLVRLPGFCCEGDARLLVYEYVANGSLDSHLFSNSSELLGWKERYQIALGTARGLAYLHEQCRDCIIHCDIKPENILLDKEFCPKVGDFGLAKLMGRDISRVLTTMRGTVGYLAPEWISGLPITTKADVYSFGMVLFELISGRRNASRDDGHRFTFFPIVAAKKVADDEVLSLLDERLVGGDADVEELRRACRVACWCIQDDECHRPSMGQIVQALEGILEVNVPPVPTALQHLVDDESCCAFTSKLESDPHASGSQ